MEPITSTLTAAKEIVEAAKTIQKVYNVSKEMKTVAESEGKDQILAAKDLAGTATKMKQESESPKGELSSNGPKIEGDLYYDKNHESNDGAENFVDKLGTTFHEVPEGEANSTEFFDKFTPSESTDDLPDLPDAHIDRLSLIDGSNVANEFADATSDSPLDDLPQETKKMHVVESTEATDLPPEKFQEFYDKNSVSNDGAENFVDKLDNTIHEVPKGDANSTEFFDKYSPSESTDNLLNLHDVNIDRLSLEDGSNVANELVDAASDSLLDNLPQETKEMDVDESADASDSPKEKFQEGLTDAEKQEIKDKTGWSDKIVDAIRTKKEAQIYMKAGLVESEINGKPALIQPQIDGKECNDIKWPDWNNKDLAEEGYPPRDKNGRPYELHHIGQNPDSPLAELTYEQHHSDGNFKVLHTFDESSIDRVQFNKERKEYWAERSKTL